MLSVPKIGLFEIKAERNMTSTISAWPHFREIKFPVIAMRFPGDLEFLLS